MCVVSMIGDHYQDKWREINYDFSSYIQNVSRAEFEALKKEVENLKELLKRAKEYDEKNNEPNCEIEEKMEFLRKVAQLVGIDLDEVFKK